MSSTASPSTTPARTTGPGPTGDAGFLDRPARAQVDPRGPRFSAVLTTLVLAGALVAAPSPLTVALLGVQGALFALSVVVGVGRTPYAWLFRTLVRPRLSPPGELEDAAAPRFAQAVGLGFVVVALSGYLSGAALLGSVATGLALAAALLNAVFDFCLGCEMFLLLRRAAASRIAT